MDRIITGEILDEDITDDRLVMAIKHLLTYITSTQMKSLSHIQRAVIKENKNVSIKIYLIIKYIVLNLNYTIGV